MLTTTTLEEEKRKEHLMVKLTLRYVRYALSVLATLGFGLDQN